MKPDRAPAGRRPSGLRDRVRLRWFAVFVAAASGGLFWISRGRAYFRCRHECYGEPPLEGYGSLTYEPGHAWTKYADSWQWSVQHGLTQLALLAAFVGLGLSATSHRNPVPAFAVTAVGLTAWVVWVLLSPPIP